MFSFIKNSLQKIYTSFTRSIHALFQRTTIDESALQELEKLLINADTGVKTTHIIMELVRKAYASGDLHEGHDLAKLLKKELIQLLTNQGTTPHAADIYLLVGINGSGKTTFASKLAHHFAKQGKRVLLVAADTFRAAAVQQLAQWAQRTDTALVTGTPNQDPASVVFTGCQRYLNEDFDVLIIDTAGRLQTKVNLMRELEKIKKIIIRALPTKTTATLLTIDAMLGQNSLEQARLFHEATVVNGIVLTKMDGTGKGGIIFAIAQELQLPVVYLSFGEQVDQLRFFDPEEYVTSLLNE
jgi:fused signal recognition particle receptor